MEADQRQRRRKAWLQWIVTSAGMIMLLLAVRSSYLHRLIGTVPDFPWLRTVETAASGRAWRIEGTLTEGVAEDLDEIKAISKPLAIPPELLRQLQGFFADPASYSGAESACPLRPSVWFEFRSGKSVVAVVVCFRCQQIMAIAGGSASGHFDFENRAELVNIVQQLFPDDTAIRQL